MNKAIEAALAVLATLFLVGATAADTPARHPITHEDVWMMTRVGNPQTSPDGRWIVFGVTEPSYDDANKVSDLWIVPADGSQPPRKLTAGKAGESDVQWSPDSTRIVFTAKREGDDEAQAYVLRVSGGGEAQRVTNLVGGASAPQWSPDGRQLLVTTRVYAGTRSEADNRKVRDERKARKYNARVYDSFPVRHWDRWLDDRQPTLVVQPLEPAGEPRDLLGGTALRAAPGYGGRLGNAGEALDATWTPDGQAVVFTATTDRDQSARADVALALWQVSAAGGEPKRLTGPGVDYADPTFTPDGRHLLAKAEHYSSRWVFNATRLVAWSWPLQGSPTDVARGFDESVGDYQASPDSRRVYFLAESAGRRKLYSAPLDGGPAEEVGRLEAGAYAGFSIGGDGAAPVVAASWGDAVHPNEVGRVDLGPGKWSALTTFTAERSAQIDWQPLQEFWFTSKRGKRIHSYVALPPGFDPAKKYPLFVMIHGGPHGMWTDEFGVRWNYHLHARPGYVVLMTDYSGSTGYGEAFSRAIQGDPLQGPADEINQAADEAIRRYAYIDASKQVAGGASYGGHLSNWLAVTTTRYRAIASHAGLYDLKTQWTTSDVAWQRERNLGGPAWNDALSVWRKQSPFYRSTKLHTPVLLTVGEKDYRVPLNNTLEFWVILQRQGVPSRLVVFPDENHWVLKGEDSRFHYQVIQDWFAQHLK